MDVHRALGRERAREEVRLAPHRARDAVPAPLHRARAAQLAHPLVAPRERRGVRVVQVPAAVGVAAPFVAHDLRSRARRSAAREGGGGGGGEEGNAHQAEPEVVAPVSSRGERAGEWLEFLHGRTTGRGRGRALT